MSITVTARGVVKAFDGKPVLRGVDLDVPEGRSTVLVGPSSSGKSVLLKCLLGLMPMDGGSVRYGDTALATLDKSELERLMRDVGVLFQQNALFDSLTVWENVAFTLIHGQGMARRAARQRALETIASVGLKPDVADLSPAELSGGMGRRVALARAIALDPDLIMYDEPFAGQDPIAMGVLLSLIRNLNAALGTTSLIVSHDINETASIADRIYVLSGGGVIGAGAAEVLKDHPEPEVRQFINGTPDGPVPFHYPAPDFEQDLLGEAVQ